MAGRSRAARTRSRSRPSATAAHAVRVTSTAPTAAAYVPARIGIGVVGVPTELGDDVLGLERAVDRACSCVSGRLRRSAPSPVSARQRSCACSRNSTVLGRVHAPDRRRSRSGREAGVRRGRRRRSRRGCGRRARGSRAVRMSRPAIEERHAGMMGSVRVGCDDQHSRSCSTPLACRRGFRRGAGLFGRPRPARRGRRRASTRLLAPEETRRRRPRFGSRAARCGSCSVTRWESSPRDVEISRRCAHCGHPTHGRPTVVGDPTSPISFSLSHSGAFALIALADARRARGRRRRADPSAPPPRRARGACSERRRTTRPGYEIDDAREQLRAFLARVDGEGGVSEGDRNRYRHPAARRADPVAGLEHEFARRRHRSLCCAGRRPHHSRGAPARGFAARYVEWRNCTLIRAPARATFGTECSHVRLGGAAHHEQVAGQQPERAARAARSFRPQAQRARRPERQDRDDGFDERRDRARSLCHATLSRPSR